jgi:hypothetical protein
VYSANLLFPDDTIHPRRAAPFWVVVLNLVNSTFASPAVYDAEGLMQLQKDNKVSACAGTGKAMHVIYFAASN